MAKSTKIKRVAPSAPKPLLEVTPERLVHAANDTLLVDATIDKAGERAQKTRRFRDSAIERMAITAAQLAAALWYLEQYTAAGISGRVTANYSPAGGGGHRPMGPKLLGPERQYQAWRNWREARATIPENMVTIIDRVVLENTVPAFRNGRQRERYALHVGKALQPMADWLGY